MQLLRDIGPAIAPLNSFLLIQGIETLSLRIERHVQNAQAIAEWLEAARRGGEGALRRAAVEPVVRGWRRSTCRKRRRRRRGVRASQGGVEAGQAFVDALELHSHLANIGDVRSLVDPPGVAPRTASSPARSSWPPGVSPGLVRLSVGLEGIEDLKADLDAGLPRGEGRVRSAA